MCRKPFDVTNPFSRCDTWDDTNSDMNMIFSAIYG